MFILPNGMSQGIIYHSMILVVIDPPQVTPVGILVAVYVVGKEGICGSRVTIRKKSNSLAFLQKYADEYKVSIAICKSNC